MAKRRRRRRGLLVLVREIIADRRAATLRYNASACCIHPVGLHRSLAILLIAKNRLLLPPDILEFGLVLNLSLDKRRERRNHLFASLHSSPYPIALAIYLFYILARKIPLENHV